MIMIPRKSLEEVSDDDRARIRTADPIMRELFSIAIDRRIPIVKIAKYIDKHALTVARWRIGERTASSIDAALVAEAIGCKLVIETEKHP